MKIRTLTLALLMAAAVTAAQAHVHLQNSVPADKSRIKAPAAIELHFSGAVRLTALTLKKGKDAATPIKPLPAEAAADISVPVPALGAGDYVVGWRLVGDDGHVMSGTFAFTVDPAAPAASSDAKKPMHGGTDMSDHAHMDHMKTGEDKKTEPAGGQQQHGSTATER